MPVEITASGIPLYALPALWPALPEIVIAIGVLALVLYGALRGERSTGDVHYAALALLALGFVLVVTSPAGTEVTFYGAFVADGFAKLMKSLALMASIVVLAMGKEHFEKAGIARFEYPILIVLATLGMMVMISANDLIALYLGVELQSLAAYVIASFHRDDARSTEAGLKYFVLGALASGMLLYGSSLVYGFTGTISFPEIAMALSDGASPGVIFGLVFIAAGLAFKVSAAPFHMWTPDVYQGAPTPVTAFFASAPKIAAMALAVRVFVGAFPTIVEDWRQIIVFIALVSMFLGAFAAIGQRDLKRLMAYSSIANVGFALVGLAAGTVEGVQGVIVYMAIYLFMTLGVFACILGMRRGGVALETIDDLAGVARTHPGFAFAIAMLMFSLAGIPPLAGFFAKYYVFLAAVEAGLVTLAVLGVVSSVIGAYYYLRIVKIVYFDEPKGAYEPAPFTLRVVITASTAFMLIFWLAPAPLVSAARSAANSLF
ncbi:MAG: NADH-quinone oxidoreductase subunit NuoN [Salinarimonadaceae bacterium]|nr:MAG: NADH-quinone oxidoreductase subunit NuoN [Salinarimonadaceae bacterium]